MGCSNLSQRAGMSLVELMVATVIFLISAIGILFSYVKAIELNSIGQGAVIASHAVKDKIEEIKSSDSSQVFANFDRATFAVTGLNGRGVVYVDNANAPLLQIKVAVCWQLGSGRVIGEDTNLNGVLNAGEDKNGNGQIDSYVQIVTQLYGT